MNRVSENLKCYFSECRMFERGEYSHCFKKGDETFEIRIRNENVLVKRVNNTQEFLMFFSLSGKDIAVKFLIDGEEYYYSGINKVDIGESDTIILNPVLWDYYNEEKSMCKDIKWAEYTCSFGVKLSLMALYDTIKDSTVSMKDLGFKNFGNIYFELISKYNI